MKLARALPLITILLAAFVGTAAHAAATAHAAIPTPTSAPTTTPTALPFAAFFGYAYLDGQISSGPVTARIGHQTCGTATILPASEVGYSYRLEIASDETTPGCGRPGAPITFFVAGQQAAQTGLWQPDSGTPLNLVAGTPFAVFVGNLPLDSDFESAQLRAFSGSQPCRQFFSTPQGGYTLNVLATPGTGCGTEGAPINFKLVDSQGNVVSVANETATWHAWDGSVSDAQQLNLTFGASTSIRVGSVGEGPESSESPWLRLSVGLALLGLASGIGAFALRRRPRAHS